MPRRAGSASLGLRLPPQRRFRLPTEQRQGGVVECPILGGLGLLSTMRLRQVKLAGFKSFVDPTVVRFPENRCAIVGPNGCGKSNVVDAVRWVLGESSARQLRAEALTDVIFNGAAGRKLAGLAMVELLFDNSDGRIGGAYASYTEIAVRREVSRDQRSTYFLNGAQCRRRDIADIFLGTGMGPRGYAIIEQGMISALVESRPDELRVHLEEAAGITKYKERRRETENRIRHTEENLARLQDIRDELAQQLDRLQRQAKAAERYRQLKAEEKQLRAELHAIRSRRLQGELEALAAALSSQQAVVEKRQAEQRRLEADIEGQRAQHREVADSLEKAEGHLYKLRLGVQRDEEAIHGHRSRLRELGAELDAAAKRSKETAHQLALDDAKIAQLEGAIAELAPAVQAAEASDAQATAELSQLEAHYRDWESSWEACSRRAAANEREAGAQAVRANHLAQMIERLQERLAQLGRDEAPVAVNGDDVDGLAAEIDGLERQRSKLNQELDACLAQLGDAQEDLAAGEAGLEQARNDVQGLRHEMAHLQAAQQVALGRSEGGLQAWLEEQGLSAAQRLGESLSVAPGWEHAVGMVLGDFVQSVKVEDLNRYADQVGALADGRVLLVEGTSEAEAAGSLPSLASLVRRSEFKLGALLHGVFAAESEAVAWAERGQLQAGESIVTRNGLWLGQDWLRHLPKMDLQAGVIERTQELETLEGRVLEAERGLESLQQSVTDHRERIRALEAQRERLRLQVSEVDGRIGELKADHGVRRTRLEEAQARRVRLKREREEIVQQLRQETERLAEAQASLRSLEGAAAQDHRQRQALTAAKEGLAAELEQARLKARAEHDGYHVRRAEQQGLVSSLQATEAAKGRLLAQAADLATSRRRIEESQAASREPLPQLESSLKAGLRDKAAVEKELGELRRRRGELEAGVRQLEAAKQEAQQTLEGANGKLGAFRVEREGLRVQRRHLAEQVAEHGYELEAVLSELPEDAAEDDWAEKLASLDRRLQRLGAINLAAIDELAAQSERKTYLDAQHEDLTKALETLLQAIHKIDRETRTRFKETFDQVNIHLGELFPKVFGGGRAHLEMTGQDLLNTGVSLMARPPGKRNASVNQLSGGEKAMTAIALIFAIFQLNPSPVCFLDEVDAPLDDANVMRFAGLIEEMSKEVQFVVVTHNKLTMEMASHLMGVTMSEPGVSRIVSVDVEKAVAMAGS